MDKIELLSEQYKNCCAENDALKAENARYREALEIIAEGDAPNHITDPKEWKQFSDFELWEVCAHDRKIARDALKGGE